LSIRANNTWGFLRFHGGGSNIWNLSGNRYYWGQLIYRLSFNVWEFSGNKRGIEVLTDYFADLLTAWYQ
jgi:hypothetical protein